MNREQKEPSIGQEDPSEGHALRNILQIVLLAAILTGAWFVLDRLINGK